MHAGYKCVRERGTQPTPHLVIPFLSTVLLVSYLNAMLGWSTQASMMNVLQKSNNFHLEYFMMLLINKLLKQISSESIATAYGGV